MHLHTDPPPNALKALVWEVDPVRASEPAGWRRAGWHPAALSEPFPAVSEDFYPLGLFSYLI